jgi:LysR family transcriptional activator of nhaA
MVCREEGLHTLLAELALHRLDLVIADRPLSSNVSVRAFNHPLGECGVSFFVHGGQARRYARGFPQVLDGAPLLLPGEGTAVRTRLLQWLSGRRIQPRIVGEFDDSSLMKAFGRAGAGIFIAPSVIASEVARRYGVSVIGETMDVRERFYAISVERRISHPAVAAITEKARSELF